MKASLRIEALTAKNCETSAVQEVVDFLDSLERSPLQHDPRWLEVFASLEGENFTVALARQENTVVGVSTLTTFSGPYGKILHANPYVGYGGCSVADTASNEFTSAVVEALIQALLAEAKAQDCVTATLSTPPFSEDLTGIYERCLQADYSLSNHYQYHILDQHPLAGLASKRREAFASEIRRAERGGVTLRRAETLAEVEAWLEVYGERYRELNASPLPAAFLKALWETFSPTGHAELQLAYCDDVHRDEKNAPTGLLGGTLFLLGRGIVDYFASAFRSNSRSLYPGTLLLDRMFTQLIERGYSHFNWQSSPDRGGVFAYKKRWGAREGQHVILTRVVGDVTPLLAEPLTAVRAGYGLHFVLPYSLWSTEEAPA
ncbi:MAG: hypothetical protein CMJ48_06245 [Planctomycetaceae bacterium]|nr:hypothetical protein [Planctomycetaceae bacterium]